MNDHRVTAGTTQIDHGRAVVAELNFIADVRCRPRFHNFDHSRDRLPLKATKVCIRDARQRPQAPGLEDEGFTLVEHRSSHLISDVGLGNLEAYAHEMERLIAHMTGAARTVAMRAAFVRQAVDGACAAARPIHFVHADYVPRSFWPQAEAALGRRQSGRYAVFNIWRSLRGPPQDEPLAVCDARTLARRDRCIATAVNDPPGRKPMVEATALFRHAESQRWYYYPDLTMGEVIIFKSFDTACASPSVAHCAFRDPSCGPEVSPRRSVDIRVFAYFPEGG